MTLETFFEQFELLADAPNGVQKLRELILQLAVQGKLVSQHPDEEDARSLITTIQAERKRLTLAKRTEKEEALASVEPHERPYRIPDTWQWGRLGLICFLLGGYAFKSSYYVNSSKNQLVRLGNVKNDQILLGQNPVYISDKIASENNSVLLRTGDILITMTGTRNKRDYCFTATIEAEHVTQTKLFLNQRVVCLRAIQPMSPKLVNLFLKATPLLDLLFESETGTANQGNIGANALRNLPFPVPPLEEQKRIVEKVDRLMKLCDELEERQRKRRESCIRLNEGAIAQLLSASSAEESDRHWQRICNNFDLLYSHPENISKLRQAILQLAVQGKLVSQDADDEPVTDFIERIRDAKNEVLQRGGQRKSKNSSSDELEAPYAIPRSWTWLQIDDFYEVVGGIQKTPKRAPVSHYFPYLRVANVYRGKLDLSELSYFELSDDELERWKLKAGDLLIVEGNGSETEIGRCAIWNGEIDDCVHQNHLIRCRPIGHNTETFTLLFLNSPAGMAEMKKLAITTSGLYSLSVGKIRGVAVPIPPIQEQQRILAKVDRLMKLCDELEAKLQGSYSHQERLMETAARQLIQATTKVPALH